MKEKPILFSAPMIRAILDGRKTVTRRAVKPVGNDEGFVLLDYGNGAWPYRSDDGDSTAHTVKRGGKLYLEETPHACPYGQPGDRLWVRETWMDLLGTGIERATGDHSRYAYRADTPDGSYGDEARKDYGLKWRPSIHMPRAASRILLEVTGVRVERLQEINEADAQAEGAPLELGELERLILGAKAKYRSGFVRLWQSINGSDSWDANPWVWVVEFKRVTPC